MDPMCQSSEKSSFVRETNILNTLYVGAGPVSGTSNRKIFHAFPKRESIFVELSLNRQMVSQR